MPYIHDEPGWPSFTWSAERLSQPLAGVRHRQGRLLGRMEALGFALSAQASLSMLTDDAVKSSAIEGEVLEPQEVRSSLARRLGLDAGGLPKPSRAVEGVVEMLLDATQGHATPLTAERLFSWHAALFPTGHTGLQHITVGAWRPAAVGAMQVVSGAIGRERVHFEAPTAARLDAEMSRFLAWFNAPDDTDPVLRAGIAHFWFVTVHPFEDGNGRIARAIGDMALARADASTQRFYSLSSRIEAERRDYYNVLERQQKGSLDITPWLSWFLDCLDRAMAAAESATGGLIDKARLLDWINRDPVNERQRRVINRLLDGYEEHLTNAKYAKLAKCSADTALRDVQALLKRGVLVQNPGGGRSTSYRLARVAEGLG